MSMRNSEHEILFFIAEQYLELSWNEKLNLGINLKLIEVNAMMLSEKALEENVFTLAYKHGKIAELALQTEKVLNAKSN